MASVTIDILGRRHSVLATTPQTTAFWSRFATGTWEPDTLRFVDRVASESPGTTFIDVGAWRGPITLYAARRLPRVLALEPDPDAFGDLRANVAANAAGNVELWHAALDLKQADRLPLYSSEGGRTCLPGRGAPIMARAVTFDAIEAAIGSDGPVAMKMDIEGYEYTLLPQLLAFVRQRGCPLHLSLHPRMLWRSHGSRVRAYRATKSAIAQLAAVGTLADADGKPLSDWRLLRLVFLKKRPKNFTVSVWPATPAAAPARPAHA